MALNVMHDRVLGDEREADVEGGTSLPAAGTHLFQMFYDTDDATLYIWDGSNWVSIGAGTPTTSFMLLETGDFILLESGDKIILE